MFGLTFEKLLVIGVIAVFILGPDKLPHYAAQLAKLVRQVRSMANTAKDRVKDEMGDEFQDVDWKKLDPRQYDPRRIIRDALLEDDAPVPATASTIASPAIASSATYYTKLEARSGAPKDLAAITPPHDSEAT